MSNTSNNEHHRSHNEPSPILLGPHEHSPLCSAFAGALRSGGNAVLGSEGIEVFKHTLEASIKEKSVPTIANSTTTVPSLRTAARIVVPGGMAFETHHAVASSLLTFRDDSTTPLGSVASHALHFLAGGAGGLSYSLALAVVSWQGVPAVASIIRHVISHGSLFGGYDCCMDLAPMIVRKATDPLGFVEDDDKIHLQQTMAIGLSGGGAGIIQHVVGRRVSGKSISLRTSLLAFPPGAFAFLAYKYTTKLLGGGHGEGHH